jgi:hypothetical protein
MSLRDYFAGQALVGLLTGPGGFKDTHEEGLSALYAGAAYEMADAMLEARAKVGSKG